MTTELAGKSQCSESVFKSHPLTSNHRTHTRNVKDAITHENISKHSHHEVTPIVNRERDETEIHQKVQPVYDQQNINSRHEHQAPVVSRERAEDIDDASAAKYQNQMQFGNERNVGDTTHSTSVNAPRVHEHVNKHSELVHILCSFVANSESLLI